MARSHNLWDWKGLAGVIWSCHPAYEGTHSAGCSGLCPGSFRVTPRIEMLQPLWKTCVCVWSSSWQKSVSWCSQGSSCVSVCGHCFSHGTPLERAWPHLLFWYLYTLIRSSLSLLSSTFISPSSLVPYSKERYSSLLLSLCCFTGFSPVCVLHMILSYTGKSKTGPRAPDQFWIEWKDHLPQLVANTPPKGAQHNICLSYCKDKLLVHVHFGVLPGFPSPFLQSCFPA